MDVRLALIEAGYHRTRHLLVDIGQVDEATTAGVRALPHAHYAAGRRGISLHLLGAGHLAPFLAAPARAALRGLGTFPDLTAPASAGATRSSRRRRASRKARPGPLRSFGHCGAPPRSNRPTSSVGRSIGGDIADQFAARSPGETARLVQIGRCACGR